MEKGFYKFGDALEAADPMFSTPASIRRPHCRGIFSLPRHLGQRRPLGARCRTCAPLCATSSLRLNRDESSRWVAAISRLSPDHPALRRRLAAAASDSVIRAAFATGLKLLANATVRRPDTARGLARYAAVDRPRRITDKGSSTRARDRNRSGLIDLLYRQRAGHVITL